MKNEKKNAAEKKFDLGYCLIILQYIDCIATWVYSSPRCVAIGKQNCIAIWWF